MLQIFQKTNRKYTRLKNRENYHILRQLGKVPTRYKKYGDLTDEEKANWIEASRKYRLKRRKTDAKYRKLLSYKALEYQQRRDGRTKVCSKCHRDRGWVAFDLRDPKKGNVRWNTQLNTYKKTLRPECKDCRKKYNKEQYELRRLHKEKELQAANTAGD